MADIDYPCKLPGFLVAGNSYSPKPRVRQNDLQSGSPLMVLDDDDGYVLFNVSTSLCAIEMQVFRNFFRYTISSGSKLFNAELMVEGFNGEKNTLTHECYFSQGQYSVAQAGKRWRVSATLIAINESIFDECQGDSLVNLFNGTDYDIKKTISDFDCVINQFECFWGANETIEDECYKISIINFENGICYDTRAAVDDFSSVVRFFEVLW